MITGIFMASGQSLRMGENKLLLPFKGKALFEYGLEAIAYSNLTDYLVVTCHDEILKYCDANKIPYVFNNNALEGQAASIRLGVSACDYLSSYMFFVADQPFINPQTINKLLTSAAENPEKIIVPTNKNISANPTIFPNKFRSKLLGLYGDVRGKQIIQNHKDMVHYVSVDDAKIFFDIDTPKDYKNLSE